MSANHENIQADSQRNWPKPPLPNTYWVEPGRVLAGEYPAGQSLNLTTTRLQTLLEAGVTLFVDLTEEGEVGSYSNLLDYVTGHRAIKYLRIAIPDHDIPESPLVMQSILDAIDEHLARGSIELFYDDDGSAKDTQLAAGSDAVYVHCRAGIGRTGTAIGCYLVRHGLTGDEALDRLNRLWAESQRSQTWPSVPETEAQSEYICQWQQHDRQAVDRNEGVAKNTIAMLPSTASVTIASGPKTDRYCGAMLGMAIGDALGALVPPDDRTAAPVVSHQAVSDLIAGGPQNLPRGAWLADTAMSWCLAESLLTRGVNDPEDQMQRYLTWQRDGQYSSTGVALNVPSEVRKALAQWQWSHKPLAGSHDPANRDAHALARTLAATLFFANEPERALTEAGEVARTTSQSPIVLDATRAFATLLLDSLDRVDKEILLSFKRSEHAQRLRHNRLKLQVTQVMDGWWRGPAPPARKDRDVLAVLSTALWAFDRTTDFRTGALLAVNGCANPASVGAVYGALAGAYYGTQGIPSEWREAVQQGAALTDLAKRLANR